MPGPQPPDPPTPLRKHAKSYPHCPSCPLLIIEDISRTDTIKAYPPLSFVSTDSSHISAVTSTLSALQLLAVSHQELGLEIF